MTSLLRGVALLSATALAAVLLAGCTSAAPPVPMTKERALSLRDAAEQRSAKWDDEYTACLARSGVVDNGPAVHDDDPRLGEVSIACGSELGAEPTYTAEEDAAVRVLNQLTIDCLRRNGATVPDLTASGDWPDLPDDIDDSQLDACEDGGDQ
ncbi:hypothetical protein [Rathayibacter iranicus]|uniref:Secreted protein n=2 Tax=Rathayibacter iranicus TaxID=59737 RepID=A0AAD1EN04_9MICO|nr:hypothetical protein [Rathayibacter iranicus]AZZ56653.1 hypothetical protein C7V51_12795 [Rathayibacter iranicus]MWV31310.1 hypothetical protein [Rathayibacter iranicus NCPPB 2253 = VKM Ac-1602]PPI43298.1 hypothetical protein C5E09_11715 [Rathayibacter iranicus]PPI58241.1 hypothetical protein C5E08_12630 [Rathayibacter iranicus]PPI69454.1 hypothetical protein C5E01_11675 [Rathayibacter iranicus]